MSVPGVVDEWSMKDLLGHIAFWAEKAAHDLQVIAAGRESEVEVPGSEQVTNQWNAREAAARKDETLAEARGEFAQSFEQARAALQAFPEDRLEMEVKGATVFFRFGGDTFAHYKEHAGQIGAWQRQLETTEA